MSRRNLNKEVIAHHFYTTEGDGHCVISLLHDEYMMFLPSNPIENEYGKPEEIHPCQILSPFRNPPRNDEFLN